MFSSSKGGWRIGRQHHLHLTLNKWCTQAKTKEKEYKQYKRQVSKAFIVANLNNNQDKLVDVFTGENSPKERKIGKRFNQAIQFEATQTVQILALQK